MSANLQPAPEPRHELAGTEMSCADIIIQVLADEGVNTVFGYSGGAILPTYDAVFRFNERREATEQMQLIVPANEQGAGFMAAGYARSTGKVGFSLVTSGPGATNSVTPIRDCFADSVPVVLVCGQVPSCCDRHRRLSGSAGLQHHDGVRQARFPGHRRKPARGDRSFGVRHRP